MRSVLFALLLVTGLSQAEELAQLAQPTRLSADGLYNLGNSYARAGKPGLAVLNYERAALLAPGDADIRANIEYVRASVRVSPEPRGPFARAAQTLSPTLAAWLGVVGIVLLGAALLAKRTPARLRWARVGGTVVGAALVGLAVSSAVVLWPRMHEAVVLINQTPVRVSPVPMADTAFALPEAETVTVAAEYGDFTLVHTRDGRSGWVARASVGAVLP
ncbi:MAG TPA: tetratricopeptide repeat protein [Steroidobacteraceae bacterium]|jgi:type IV secretory pathway VirB2 component (pilin)